MYISESVQLKSVWHRWQSIAEEYPEREAVIFWAAGEEPIRWTYGTLFSEAEKFSAALKKYGIKKGEVCALIIRHNPAFFPLYMAVAGLGAIPAVLAFPNPRLHPEKFRQGLEGMSHRSGLDWILSEKELDSKISPLVSGEGSTIKGVLFPLEWTDTVELTETELNELRETRDLFTPDDPFLLQHSSGTTGLQKPVLLSNREVLEHVQTYSEAIGLKRNDAVVSWLPLYHDMGLIAAFQLPLAMGIKTIQMDPFEWVLAPGILLEAVSKERATITWLPNFAYNVLADKVREDDLDGISLESLRLIINCSEPVRQESHRKFEHKYFSYGLKPYVLSTCYAMAEATFAVTQSKPGKQVSVVFADRQELSKGKVCVTKDTPSSRACVSSGKTIKDCRIKIIGENGEELGEGLVGEIAISSRTLFDGYRNYPEKTAEVLRDGWYYSGDYGFRYNDEYYIIGRKKDIIIVAGNNIYPEDVEDAVSKVEGVIAGRAIAFGEEDAELGSEQVSVVAETDFTEEKDLKNLKLAIIKAGMMIDVNIKKVYLVPPRWLIKSSAGKPSRKANMERILQNKELIEWR